MGSVGRLWGNVRVAYDDSLLAAVAGGDEDVAVKKVAAVFAHVGAYYRDFTVDSDGDDSNSSNMSSGLLWEASKTEHLHDTWSAVDIEDIVVGAL